MATEYATLIIYGVQDKTTGDPPDTNAELDGIMVDAGTDLGAVSELTADSCSIAARANPKSGGDATINVRRYRQDFNSVLNYTTFKTAVEAELRVWFDSAWEWAGTKVVYSYNDETAIT